MIINSLCAATPVTIGHANKLTKVLKKSRFMKKPLKYTPPYCTMRLQPRMSLPSKRPNTVNRPSGLCRPKSCVAMNGQL